MKTAIFMLFLMISTLLVPALTIAQEETADNTGGEEPAAEPAPEPAPEPEPEPEPAPEPEPKTEEVSEPEPEPVEESPKEEEQIETVEAIEEETVEVTAEEVPSEEPQPEVVEEPVELPKEGEEWVEEPVEDMPKEGEVSPEEPEKIKEEWEREEEIVVSGEEPIKIKEKWEKEEEREDTAWKTCPEPPEHTECPPNHAVMSNFNEHGCIVGYDCVEYERGPECLAMEIEREKQRCMERGGDVRVIENPSGCDYVECIHKRPMEESISINPVAPVFGSEAQCPSPEHVDEAMRRCEEDGMKAVIDFDRGCKIAKCINEEFRDMRVRDKCGYVSEPERLRIEEKCRSMGLESRAMFDERGCQTIDCIKEDRDYYHEGEFCERDPPPEAFGRCEREGGEMVVKRDDRDCVVFTKCVRRGDEADVYIDDPIEELPEMTKLLDIAFKLENLRIEIDELARQSMDIARYYDSVGSPDAERYKRVADMFEAAKGTVDEIKTKLRDRIRDITVDDLMEVKHDIKYLKDVVITDIVYLMLSTSEDVNDMIRVKTMEWEGMMEVPEGANCGTDGGCFDRALRVCKPVEFLPEGRRGPTVHIDGLEGNGCAINVRLPDGEGPPPGVVPGLNPPYEMKCIYPDYAMGMRGPDDMLPYCEGSLVTLMKLFGTGPDGPDGRPPGPGGCISDEECGEFCAQNPEECMRWCDEHPGMCPSHAEEKLRTLHAIRVMEG